MTIQPGRLDTADHCLVVYKFSIVSRTMTKSPLCSVYDLVHFSLPTPFDKVLLGCSWKDSPLSRLNSDVFPTP